MTFYSERPIKAVRKARRCVGCNTLIQAGLPAITCAGINYDGDFWAGTYHPECRAAETSLNTLHDLNYDEWICLSDIDWEDYSWLIEEFPLVAQRMQITLERLRECEERQRRYFLR